MFLAVDNNVYLPPIDNVTIYFLKAIINTQKRHLTNDQIQTIYVPGYDNLTIKHIGAFAMQQPNITDYLPDHPDLKKVPKQWIVNVCSAVIGAPFRAWVSEQIKERNELMKSKKNMMINIDSKMAQNFANSTHVSCMLIDPLCYNLLSFIISEQGRQCQHVEVK